MASSNVFLKVVLLCLVATVSLAQDTIQVDSTNRVIQSLQQQLTTYERLIKGNSLRRKQDSLARVDLMRRIQLLQESDVVTQATLRGQIRQIEKRDSVRNAQQQNRIIELRSTTLGYPVVPFKDTLFTIFTKLGPIQAGDRASNVTKKIEILVRDDYFYPDSLMAEERDGTVDIMYRKLIVASISDWDALWMSALSKSDLANEYVDTIKQYVASKRNRSTVRNMLARIGLVFLILGVVAIVIYLLNRLATGVKGWMVRNKEKYFSGIKIGNYQFLPPARQLDAGLKSVLVLKWSLFILVFYLSLPVIFGIFPFTKGWAQTLLSWILSPARDIWLSFWNYLPNFFSIAVIFLITRYFVRFLRFIALEIEHGNLRLTGFHADWAIPTFRLVRFIVYAFMFVVIYPYLPGSDSDIFKGVSVFVGLLISLGSTSAIGNAVAGLVITYMRPFRVGDRVKIGEVMGEIVEKSLLVTRIRTTKNEDITVPNAAILTGHTVNYSTSSQDLGLILHTSVTIGYDVPWRKVHELLIEAAVGTEGINISREPFVLQTSLDDWYVSYQVNAYTDLPDRMAAIYSDLHSNIQDKFNAAGIEIMSPHYRAVRDGNQTTVPKK